MGLPSPPSLYHDEKKKRWQTKACNERKAVDINV